MADAARAPLLLLRDVVTEAEAAAILSKVEAVRAAAAERPARSVEMANGKCIPVDHPIAISQEGPWGTSGYSLVVLDDPAMLDIEARIRERIEAKTDGISWKYGQNQAMLPVNRYESEGFIHPHRDVDLGGWGDVRAVATISLCGGYQGGELFVNSSAKLAADGVHVLEELAADRHLAAIPPLGAAIFDNFSVVHGTVPVSAGVRYTATIRSSAVIPQLVVRSSALNSVGQMRDVPLAGS